LQLGQSKFRPRVRSLSGEEPNNLQRTLFMDIDRSEARQDVPRADERETVPYVWDDPSPGADADRYVRAGAADRLQRAGNIFRLQTLLPIGATHMNVHRPRTRLDRGRCFAGLLRRRKRNRRMFRAVPRSVNRSFYEHSVLALTQAVSCFRSLQ
jgi:hypothetical protein